MPVRSAAVPMRPKGTAAPTSRFFSPGRLAFVLGEERIHPVPMLAIDHAGRDGVDVDAVLDQVQPRRLGQADDGGLGGAVDARPAPRPGARPGDAMLMILPPCPCAIIVLRRGLQA